MKISILLPFKENFSPSYAGAVSLFINDTLKFSKFRKSITVYGFTNYKKKFKNKYINITGKQYTAVKDLIKIIGKSLGINKKIDFSHKKYLGHYILEPKKYELRNASNFKMNKDIKLKDGIKSYLREFSND